MSPSAALDWTLVLVPDHAVSELTLPAFDGRVLARRLTLPVIVGVVALVAIAAAGGPVHRFAAAVRHGLGMNGGWIAVGAGFECVSLAGYVLLLSLITGKATARIGARESAQITLAGAAATRLLPTAGAGGAGLTLWSLRRAGLTASDAVRTLLVFLVVLYSIFLTSIVVAGGVLALGLFESRGPILLSAIPAVAAALCIALAVLLAASRWPGPAGAGDSRVRRTARLFGDAVGDAFQLVRSGDPRLAGAIGYWAFDAAVLWAMLHAVGSQSSLPVVALAYFIGQVANTLPLPGSVSGGITGVLIAFGVPAELGLPSVLAYRTIAVWLPTPVAIAAVPGLRSTFARWGREDGVQTASSAPLTKAALTAAVPRPPASA